MRVAAAAIVVLCVLTGATGAQQQQASPPSFRTTTRLVVQAVTVKDRQNRPIAGLTPADFEIRENGRAQEVAFADYQPLESATADRQPLPSEELAGVTRAGIRAPRSGNARFRGRRLLVFYFDHTTMSASDLMRAYAGAIAYVDARIHAADAIAVVTFAAGAVQVHEDFTDERDRLIERLRLLAAGGDANGDGVADDPASGTAFGENGAEFNVFSTDRQLAALLTLIAQLRPIPEQKAIVYFGGGLRLNGVDNQAQLRATVNAAVRANVTINPIDARGLTAVAPLGDATRATTGGTALFSGALAQGLISRLQRSHDTLHALAADTGGIAALDDNDVGAGVVRASAALTSYYLVGYYSTDAAADGRLRRVRVSLRDRPDAVVAYRESYAAEKAYAELSAADRERQLEEALRSEDPITDVPLAVQVNAFRLTKSEYYVPVSVQIPTSELALARRRGSPRTRIDVIGEVKDEHGVTHRNMRDGLDIALDDRAAGLWMRQPLQYETGFSLLPGTYVLKLLVRDATTGRIGTYETRFEVRNLDRERDTVPISSVVLAGRRMAPGEALHAVEQRLATEAVNPLVIGGQRFVPSVSRVFSAARDLHVLLHAYDTPAAVSVPVVAHAALYQGAQRVRQTNPVVFAGPPAAASGAVPIAIAVPLAGLDPGEYECQVTVLSPRRGAVTFWRGRVVVTP